MHVKIAEGWKDKGTCWDANDFVLTVHCHELLGLLGVSGCYMLDESIFVNAWKRRSVDGFKPNQGLIEAQWTYPRDGRGGPPTLPVDAREQTFHEESFLGISVANKYVVKWVE